MRRLFILFVLGVLGILVAPKMTKGTHITGGNFEVQCVGQDSFLIRLVLFRDCDGIALNTAPIAITLTNSCGDNINANLQYVPNSNPGGTPTGPSISNVCSSQQFNTACGNGTLPGMEMYIFEAIVVIPSGCDGDVTVLATGGTGGFSYNWPKGKTGQNQTDLCAGTYIVTATDNTGCKRRDTITLAGPSGLNLTPTVTEISCDGICDGQISFAASGGTAPYTYAWSNGASTNTQISLCPGEYGVTVMDAVGHQFRYYVTLDNPSPIQLNTLTTNENCNGACNGTATVSVTGGIAPFTYDWDNGNSGASISNLCPGQYVVTVTDANGCLNIDTTQIGSGSIMNASLSLTNLISCYNDCAGAVNASITGGVAPYTIEWSNGGTGVIQNNLCAGSYAVTVTDAVGCQAISSINIAQPVEIILNESVTEPVCGVSPCNGGIDLNPIGGAGIYTYAWNLFPNPGNVSSVTGLCPGVYEVTVSDQLNCSVIKKIAISNNNINSSFTFTQPTCYSQVDGSISVVPTGGTGPYVYNWDNGTVLPLNDNIAAGTHIVTITDANGCKFVETVELSQPDSILIDFTFSKPLCSGDSNGFIIAAPTGGTGPYSYAWSGGQTGDTLSGIPVGNYSVTVTDANGCSKPKLVTLTGNPILQGSIATLATISCAGVCDGYMEVTPSGGVEPYAYAWSNGATSAKNINLCAGIYTVTVTDANGCAIVTSEGLSSPNPINTAVNTNTGVGCNGTWSTSYNVCCRSNGISNVTNPGFESIHVDIGFNTNFEDGDCNSTTSFNSSYQSVLKPMKYTCAGINDCFELQASDPDGDSLFFQLVAPQTGANTTVNYIAPNSPTNPFPGILSFDTATGVICFNVPNAGFYIFSIQVTEYDAVTGLWKSESFRDIQLVVETCPNNNIPPIVQGNSIQNFNSPTGATLTDSNSIVMCANDSICFDVVFLDSNLADTGMLPYTNARDVLNYNGDSATVTIGILDTLVVGGDSVVRKALNICWTAPPQLSGTFNFTVSTSDDHCNIPAYVSFPISVFIIESTSASPDSSIICGSQSIQLNAAGGNVFTWQVISGDPIVVGSNFSCNGCTSPIATPSVTTVYEVVSDLTGNCVNRDTVVVNVAQDFTLAVGPDTVICAVDSIQMYSTPSIAGNFDYQWSYGFTMDDGTLQNPKAYPTQTTYYTVSATSDQGCAKNATALVYLTPPFPNLTPHSDDTLLCIGDSAQIELRLGNATSAGCSIVPTSCSGLTQNIVLGAGVTTNTQFNFPAPYGNSTPSARHQFLIRATELTALGFSKGLITGIGFDVASVNGVAAINNFSMGIGCTSASTMGFSWHTTQQVLAPTTVNVSAGWNVHAFSLPYSWDGVSNLVVEICFDNGPGNTSFNASTYRDNTGWNSVLYLASGFTPACSGTSLFTASSNQRPKMFIQYCPPPDAAAYTFAWNPDSTLTNNNNDTTIAYPSVTTTYQVIVNDTFGVCSDTADITIYKAELNIGPDTIVCLGDSFQLTPTITQSCNSGNAQFSWLPITGVSDPTVQSPTFSVTSTTQFTLTYNDPCGCTLYDTILVTVDDIQDPVVSLTPPECGLSDGLVELTAVGGYAPYSYTIDSANTYSSTNLFNNIGQGYYYYQVQDSLGCVSNFLSDTIINPNTPVIDSIRVKDLICDYQIEGEIEIYAHGGVSPYKFSINNGASFGFNSLFNGLSGGYYDVIVEDDSNCQTLPVQVAVQPVDPLALDSINSSSLACFDDASGSIYVHAHGGTGSVEFTIDSGNTYHSTGNFINLTASDYYVFVRDSNYCKTPPQLVQLTQQDPLKIALTVNNDSCFNACGGFAEAVITGGTQPFTYFWTLNNPQQTPISANLPTTSNLCPDFYKLSVRDGQLCTKDTVFQVSTPPLLKIDSVDFQNVGCSGESTGNFTIFFSGGTPPYNYSVDGWQSYVTTNQNVAIFNNVPSNTYLFEIKDSAFKCSESVQIEILEPTPVEIDAAFNEAILCVSNCTTLTVATVGGTPPYNFIWSDNRLGNTDSEYFCPIQNPDNDTIVVVYAVDARGCASNIEQFKIGLHDSLKVDVRSVLGICSGDSVKLESEVSGGEGTNYLFSWTPAEFLKNSFVQNPIGYPSVSSNLILTVNDQCGSPAVVDSVFVEVYSIPAVTHNLYDTVAGCEPFDLKLINTSARTNTVEWSLNDVYNATGIEANITGIRPGKYDIYQKITTPEGCVNEKTYKDVIQVFPRPRSAFKFEPEFGSTQFNSNVKFLNESIGEDIVQYVWTVDGMQFSVKENPNYVFSDADTGSYLVNLYVESEKGCYDDSRSVVRINANFNFYIPNTFTPNDDGTNDVFLPYGIGIEPTSYTLRIYNRWGEEVFSTNSIEEGWDGNYDGKPAKGGPYVYKINITDITNEFKEHEFIGNVNLLR